jgi:Mg-chelatase subunit ChlI
MLIRGAPGSGKTTLALEILARNIILEKPAFGIFLSLEVEPLDAWKAVVHRLSPEVIACLPHYKNSKFDDEDQCEILKKDKTTLLLVGRKWCQIALPFGSSWDVVETRLNDQLTKLVKKIKDTNPSIRYERGIIVIDSVNLLGEHLQKGLASRGQHAEMRSARCRRR